MNGVAVPKSRLDAAMQQEMQRGAPNNDQVRAQVRNLLIDREVIMQEAAKSGVLKNPEVQQQIDLARQQVVINAYLSDWVRKHPIPEDEIQKEYDRARSQTGDKEYKARHVLVETEDQAKAVISDLKKGVKFEDLARKNSKDPGTKDRGGDLDWNVPGVFDKAFGEAMVGLQKGKYTETPVQTRFGFHVIQLDDVRQINYPPLAQVRGQIQQQLVSQKIEGMLRDLRGKAKIE